MLIPIVCFTCGLPLADKEDLFYQLRKKQLETTKSTDFQEILHMLDINNDCCKMHFITAMQFTDYY